MVANNIQVTAKKEHTIINIFLPATANYAYIIPLLLTFLHAVITNIYPIVADNHTVITNVFHVVGVNQCHY